MKFLSFTLHIYIACLSFEQLLICWVPRECLNKITQNTRTNQNRNRNQKKKKPNHAHWCRFVFWLVVLIVLGVINDVILSPDANVFFIRNTKNNTKNDNKHEIKCQPDNANTNNLKKLKTIKPYQTETKKN